MAAKHTGKKNDPIPKSTKAPTDLKIEFKTTINNTAKKLSLSASWGCPSGCDYNGGQQFIWRRTANKNNPGTDWPKKTKRYVKGTSKATINKSERSVSFADINLEDFYPTVWQGDKCYIRWVKVWVRGQNAKYKKQKKVKNKKVDVWYDPKWSAWSMRVLHILPPPKPVLGEITAGVNDFSKVFSWTVPQESSYISDSTTRKNKDDQEVAEIFFDTRWESILVNTAKETYSEDMWTDGQHNRTAGSMTPGETSSTYTITENPNNWGETYSYTRYFRVKSQGPAGPSEWVMTSFVYSQAPAPKAPKSSTITKDDAGTPIVTIEDDEQLEPLKFPVKYTILQSSVVTPITTLHVTSESGGVTKGTVTISPPPDSDASWTEIKKVPGTGTISGRIDSFQPENKMVWTRVVRVDQGDNMAKGVATRCDNATYPLSDPTGISISDIQPSTGRITVVATNNSSDIAASVLAIHYRDSANPGVSKCVGIIPHGETSQTVNLNPWGDKSIDIGVEAVVGNYLIVPDSEGNGVSCTFQTIYMKSNVVWHADALPKPPTGLTLSRVKFGTIRATWTWSWLEADSTEISWADHEDAWESTSQPNTYTITNTNTGQWNISDLSVGEWWVRVRFIKNEGDATTYGMYSEAKSIKVVSTPEIPFLTVTPDVITPDGAVTLTWVYTSEDGEGQSKVEIARDEDHSRILYTATTQTSVTLRQKDIGWSDGETVNLSIKVTSDENIPSEWSKPAQFHVASLPKKPTVTLGTGFEAGKSVTVGDDTLVKDCLVSTPFSFNISNVASTETVSVIIERAAGSMVERPDESEYPVYAGELAYLGDDITGQTSYSITVNQKDLLNNLDDDHDYILRVKNVDRYGQSNQRAIPFRVYWTHQAVIPSADVVISQTDYTATIYPKRPATGYLNGDTVDIYRLSVDKPQLIFSGAQMTSPPTAYIDPFPTIGEFGGYRIVYRTLNGDYRLRGASSNIAFTDYTEDDPYIIDEFLSIIDFGSDLTDQVILRYDLSLSNSWKKDFTETRYLGGAIQGDWNPGVSRTGSIKGRISIEEDPFLEDPTTTITALRRLAVWPGICHVRTPDGSAYYANVEVNEDREEKWTTRVASFTLNITRVDSPLSFEEGSSAEDNEDDEDEE